MEKHRPQASLRAWACVSLLAVLAVISALRLPAALEPQAVPLVPGQLVERSISGSASHPYRVRGAAGYAFAVVVESRGVEMTVSLVGPSGKPLLALAAPDWTGGTQEVRFVAPSTGDYRLTLSAEAGTGTYRLRIDGSHPAAERDRLLGAATTALSEGDRFRRGGRRAEARSAYNRAAALSARLGEPSGRALALYRLGAVEEEAQRRENAVSAYAGALGLWKRGVEANAALNGIGRCQSALGQTEEALSTFQKVADRAALEGDRLAGAAALANLAQLYTNRGDYRLALDLFGKARKVFHDLRLEAEEAVALDNLGEVRYDLGAWQEGIDACMEAREIQERIGDRRHLPLSLRNLGAIYLGRKRWDDARDLLEKTAQLARQEGDTTIEAGAENGLSYLCLEQGDVERALDTARTALRLARSVENPRLRANALGNLGVIEGRKGRIAEALIHLDEAARIYRAQQMPEEEASILFGHAEILELAGRLDEAVATIEKAIRIVESLRMAPDGGDLRASFFASRQDYYELYVRVLMKLDVLRPLRGYDIRAFEASETTRARTLLDGLALARFNLRAGADPALVRREADLDRLLREATQHRLRRALGEASGDSTDLTRLDREVRELRSDLEQVRAEMGWKNRRYRMIAGSHPLSLPEIQREVLDPGTLLLVYSLGEQGSFLWAIDRTSLRSYRLPDRRRLGKSAERAYEALKDDGESKGDLAQLSEMLLRPVAGELGGRRLLVVADGTLQYVPFAALPEPHPRGLGDVLLAGHDIAYLPSVSAAKMLREERRARSPAPKDIALLGDPVFSRDDERLIAALRGTPRPAPVHLSGHPGDALRSARDLGVESLRRLPYSGREVDSIFKLVPAGRGLKAVGFDATRELATSPDLARYQILHLATHGFLDDSNPELSGLVFSMFDSQGRPRDGFLHAYEIYSLHLSADLVVLSACRTALGTEVRGEGILGLTRGFMYAGVPRVVVSLWNINDRATAYLMERFYEGMFRQHLTPAAALRAAQLATRERWASISRWAAFELQGDWR